MFDNLPEGLPRLISIGRLDFNTEGLLLLTNDGGLARALELPDTGWLRRYRVRAHGEVTQAQLDELEEGRRGRWRQIRLDRCDARARPGRQCLAGVCDPRRQEPRGPQRHGASRPRGEPADPRLLRTVPARRTRRRSRSRRSRPACCASSSARRSQALPAPTSTGRCRAKNPTTRRLTRRAGKKPFKPAGKSALIADRKGRRVLVQRTGSDEARARNEEEANGYGPPRRPQRGYHGKRDLKPRDE